MKTQTKKVGFEKDPAVLKACLGYGAWGGFVCARLRGQRSAGSTGGSVKQGRMSPVVSIRG